MKLRIQHILAFFSVLAFSGCAENPALFSETDGIYFDTPNASINYSFAKYPKKKVDTIQIPVNVLGNSFGTDRSIDFEVVNSNDANAAVQGTHFKILDNPIIPANTYKGAFYVEVNRTEDLESDKVVQFTIKLKQNDAFPSEGITSKKMVTVNLAYLQRPATWGTDPVNGVEFAVAKANFGTWTPTKYKLILDALYDEETGTTITEFPIKKSQPPLMYTYYVTQVKNYLKTRYPGNFQGGTGDQLIDPYNNKPVMVGDANNYY